MTNDELKLTTHHKIVLGWYDPSKENQGMGATSRKRTRGGKIMSEQPQYDKKKVIQYLTIFKVMGFEIIKSNFGQTALNTVNNDMPLVINNDVGYMTPRPDKWEFIADEIKRLQKELAEEWKDE